MSAMQELLRRYGQSATLKNPAGEKTIRVFLQPEKAREEGVPGTITPIGWVDDRLWSYIGLEAVEPGDVIVLCGKGHETYQEIGHEKRHLDEREVVADFLGREV